jgi:predicted nucleotidyltransferase
MFVVPDEINDSHTIFVCVVGSHAQNAADYRSDVDYHCVFMQPTIERLSMIIPTVDSISSEKGASVDYVGHEVEKYLKMLLKSNCNALEDINSPIMLSTNDYYFPKLKKIADECITKSMHACYQGISIGVKKRILVEKYDDRTFKKHHRNMFRNIFTGIHALEEGEIIIDYEVLKELFDYHEPEYEKWERDFDRYMYDLDWAFKHSDLNDATEPQLKMEADEFLLDLRENLYATNKRNDYSI